MAPARERGHVRERQQGSPDEVDPVPASPRKRLQPRPSLSDKPLERQVLNLTRVSRQLDLISLSTTGGLAGTVSRLVTEHQEQAKAMARR